MKPIVTLTLNPTIDGASRADKVRPIHKIRTVAQRYEPGGGGINVARVVRELGGEALAIYLAGGATGGVLDQLIEAGGLPHRSLPIRDHTRISHTVFETSSGLEFRFVPEGPAVDESEWTACLDAIRDIDCDFLVCSGSLPRGVPEDFYAQVGAIAKRRGTRLVLDTSGAALKAALQSGVHLTKPSLGEFESFIGETLPDPARLVAAARDVVRSGATELLAVSLGKDGAVLATRDGAWRLAAPKVEVKNTVGAGDSFVAAMALGLARGLSAVEAFAYGGAAGTATVMSVGTGQCRRAEVERLYPAQLADVRDAAMVGQ